MRNKGSPEKDNHIIKIGIVLTFLTLIVLICVPILTTECRIVENEKVENDKTVLSIETVPAASTFPEEKTERQGLEETDISLETSHSTTVIADVDVPLSDEPPIEEEASQITPIAPPSYTDKTPTITPVHTHQYTKTVRKATCIEAEVTISTCSCGDGREEITAEAIGHTFKKNIVAPTTKAEGYDEFICTRCAYSYKTNYKEKLPSHSHNYEVTNTIAATCDTAGYTNYVCACGDTKREQTEAARGHNMQEVPNDGPACAITTIVSKCTNCDYEETKEVEAEVSHVFNLRSSDEEQVEDEIVGDEPPQVEEYTGDATATCEECGQIAPLYMTGTQTYHHMGAWTNYGPMFHSRSCLDAGCNYIEAEKHVYGIGYKKNPTCTKGTVIHWQCVLCKRESLVVEKSDALGHNFQFVQTVPPVDDELGYDLMKCTRCPATDKQNYKSNIEHKCTYKESEISPTCTVAGEKIQTCTICKKVVRLKTLAPLGHDYRQMIKHPTCQEAGGRIQKCVRCDDEYFVENFGTVPHNYVLVRSEFATTGWAGFNEYTCSYCQNTYKEEIPKLKASEYPKGYRDDTCTIIIYKEWYENAYVYAAHITYTDYDRLWVECSKGKYNSGGETTSAAAKRVGAILAINGDYAVPGNGASGYAIARKGVVCNDKKTYAEGVYNSHTGMLLYGQSKGIGGVMLSELVANKQVTDTFQFGPCMLLNGRIIGDPASTSRAQRTFIGTSGNPGDIWLCVSDGRYNDGKSAGLNGYQCGAYLASKGCTLGVPLDGGGSTTMYFNGSVLNAAKNGQRAVVDFVMFK